MLSAAAFHYFCHHHFRKKLKQFCIFWMWVLRRKMFGKFFWAVFHFLQVKFPKCNWVKRKQKKLCEFFSGGIFWKRQDIFWKKWQFLKVKQFEKNVCSWAAGNSTYDLNICNPHFFLSYDDHRVLFSRLVSSNFFVFFSCSILLCSFSPSKFAYLKVFNQWIISFCNNAFFFNMNEFITSSLQK